jgi:RNA polymerase sigma factor (TIGR02999 family)
MHEHTDINDLLERVKAGDHAAVEQLLTLAYKELRRIAANMMRRERQGHTLQPTALVHEAYARMFEREGARFENRAHFFAVAAKAMRHILVDYARRRLAARRGGADQQRVELLEDNCLTVKESQEVLAVNEALDRLAALDERQARIVEMHYYTGNTVPEIATVMGMSERTVQRELKTGRLFLKHQLQNPSPQTA